jgi:hypothetical protein
MVKGEGESKEVDEVAVKKVVKALARRQIAEVTLTGFPAAKVVLHGDSPLSI